MANSLWKNYKAGWKNNKAPAAQKAAPAFSPDGQKLPDGSVRYKIICDGGINPSGVFWMKIVPPGASTADYVAAQAERDEALKRLATLGAKASVAKAPEVQAPAPQSPKAKKAAPSRKAWSWRTRKV